MQITLVLTNKWITRETLSIRNSSRYNMSVTNSLAMGDNGGDHQASSMEVSDSANAVAMGHNQGEPHVNSMEADDSTKGDTSKLVEGSSEDDDANITQYKIEYINIEIEELQKALVQMKENSNERELQYDLLVQTTIRKDKDMVNIKNRLLDLEKRSMNKNIRINNLPERPRENPAQSVNSFLQDKVQNTEYDIEVAHRNGPKNDSQDTRSRPMIVQLAKRSMVDKIMKATRNDGDYNRDDIRVTRQIPTELRHITAKLHHIADFAKKCHPAAKIEVKDKAIFINNQKRKPPLIPPTIERTLTCDPDEIDVMKNINFFASDLIGLKGSTFRAFVSPASCVERCQRRNRAPYRSRTVCPMRHSR